VSYGENHRISLEKQVKAAVDKLGPCVNDFGQFKIVMLTLMYRVVAINMGSAMRILKGRARILSIRCIADKFWSSMAA
jgi:hypothetical protein